MNRIFLAFLLAACAGPPPGQDPVIEPNPDDTLHVGDPVEEPVDLPEGDLDGDGCLDSEDPHPDQIDDADGDGVCNLFDACFGDDALGDEDGDGLCGDWTRCAVPGPTGACVDDLPTDPVHLVDSWLVRLRAQTSTCDGSLVGFDADWRVERAFPNLGNSPVETHLSAFCVVRYVGAGAAPTPPLDLREDLFGSDQVSQLRAIVTAQAPRPEDVLQFQSKRFLNAVNAPIRLPVFSSTPPRLAFVDSSPTSSTRNQALTEPGTEAHGLILANIAQRLVCPDGTDCAAEVATRGVFDATAVSPTRAVSAAAGELGTLLRLAAGIVEEVHHIEQTPEEEHLILNLSLGWHPVHGGLVWSDLDNDFTRYLDAESDLFHFAPGHFETWPVDTQAVYLALGYARCHGALIFAAAGNDTAGPRGDEGLLLPGAWSEITDDHLPLCAGPQPIGPLVHAVGGMGAERGLAVSRPDSVPFFNAVGTEGYADLTYSAGGTTIDPKLNPVRAMRDGVWPRSGTSVSTAVVSSIAAITWAAYPEWSASEVASMMWRAGQPTTRQPLTPRLSTISTLPTEIPIPSSHQGQTAGSPLLDDTTSARLLSACEVLGTLAQYQPDREGPLTAVHEQRASWCPRSPPSPPETPAALYRLDHALTPTTSPDVCGTDLIYDRGTNGEHFAEDPCLDRQFYGIEIAGGVAPQPSTHQCPLCFIDWSTGRLHLDFLDPSEIRRVGLRLETGSAVHQIVLPPTTPLYAAMIELPVLHYLRDEGIAEARIKSIQLAVRNRNGRLRLYDLAEWGL